MGHIDISGVDYYLADGRLLLSDVSFRVGDGAKVALVGANGAGKTTLMRLVAGDLEPDGGSIVRSGSVGVMRQFIGNVRDQTTVRELLLSVAAPRIRRAAEALTSAESALSGDDRSQLRYAAALSNWGDAGGYDAEVLWDTCTTAALGLPIDEAGDRPVTTLSGGEQKRLVLEALLRGPDDVLLLDEPDNYLDVPAKRWLEESLVRSPKTVLYVSHDRELLDRTATRVVTVELGGAGNTVWTHAGGFAGYHQTRQARFERFEELRRRWDEDREKLRELVRFYKVKAAYNDGMASRYQAAVTRLAKFEEIGPPPAIPREQDVRMDLRGARTGKKALVCSELALTGLTDPFDLEVWYGERLAVLGANGSGKSHFLRLLALGGTDPGAEHRPAGDQDIAPVDHSGTARLGARVRPGWFAQTHEHPELIDRTLVDILWNGDAHRQGMGREHAMRALGRYELSEAGNQTFETLSGGQQARFQVLLLELSGATMLLLDEPTDNLDLVSAEALESALERFDGTVIAVTHDRWFARSFSRYLVFGSDGNVHESDVPVWDDQVAQAR